MPTIAEHEAGPTHREIMSELRAIRSQMAAPPAASDPNGGDANRGIGAAVDREVAEARATLETYRAQIEQCEKLKVELDLIHDAINRTKREIAVLHGKSFSGEEMARVNGELGAVVGGTEEATQQILEAAEAMNTHTDEEPAEGDRRRPHERDVRADAGVVAAVHHGATPNASDTTAVPANFCTFVSPSERWRFTFA